MHFDETYEVGFGDYGSGMMENRNLFSLCVIDRRRTPPSQGFIIGNNPQYL